MGKGAALIAAAGFERGMLTAGFQLAGEGAVVKDGSLSLTPSSSLAIGTPGLPTGGASLSFELLSGTAVASLRLENGQALSIDTNGSILSGAVQSRIDLGTSKRIQYAVKVTENGLELHGANGETIAIPVFPAADAQWIISAAPENQAEITRVLVTAFELPLAKSSADDAQEKPMPITRLPLETAGML
jgi:hypothetical protein